MPFQERPEARVLFHALLDGGEDGAVVVDVVGVGLQPGAELDEDVTQALVLTPVPQPLLQLWRQNSEWKQNSKQHGWRKEMFDE